jgi:cyanate permease
MPLAAFLLAMALPIAKKVFIALGLGIVTFTGLSLILNQLQSYIITSIGGVTADAAQVAALFGFHQSVGILLAAITTKFAMASFTRWTKS